MNLNGRTVWQQASGDTERDYADLCLKHGVILNGYDAACVPPPSVDFVEPGVSRVLAPGSPPAIEELRVSKRKKSDLTRFCHTMKSGDIVVLRRGTSQVLGVGWIDGPYFFDDNFCDIDGWNLPLARQVSWFWSAGKTPRAFGTYKLKQGDTTQRLKPNGEVWQWLESLPEPAPLKESQGPRARFPHQKEISIEAVSDYLFDQGIASDSIRGLLAQMGELVRIAGWYQRTHQSPSESETIAYLVAPLLRVLGWTPQKMAVEWNHVDVALFASLPRSNDSLRVVVEVKKMHASCLTAESQAKRYALGKGRCHRLILTDGLRYAVHTREATDDFKLAAYLNLTRMRDHYPVLGCQGAQDSLLLMAPEMDFSSDNTCPKD